MKRSMNIIDPPGGAGGGALVPLMPPRGKVHRFNVTTKKYCKYHYFDGQYCEALKHECRSWPTMSADVTGWVHTQPMPMRGAPCVVSEQNALAFTSKLPIKPRVFLFSDSERAIPGEWGFVASVRQGTPPEGIMAELDAWIRQNPDAWLAVDLRVGVIPPAIANLEEILRTFPRVVIVIVSDDSRVHPWPRWELPF